MGFRNPFRFSVDQETGWISMADYSPDNGTDAPATRGPAGISEWNLIKSPGNYGWPLCMGANEPFRDVDYRTNPVTVGAFFDCANPVNDSIRNTGLTNLPPARAADMYYGYQRSSVPSVIPQGGGLAPMGGPFYRFDEDLESDTKFPASYDGKPFFYDWARNKMFSIQVKDPATGTPGTEVEKVNPFLPQQQFLAPIDSKFGPDGSLYVLDWGGGFGRDNPTSGLYRVDYISGSRSPVARVTTDVDSGQAPLTVAFDGTGSTDPEGATLHLRVGLRRRRHHRRHRRDGHAHLHRGRALRPPPDGDRPGRQDRHHDGADHGRQHPTRGRLQPAAQRLVLRLR